MKAANRLRKNEDFRKVYKEGNSIANKLLILYIKKNGFTYNRAGFTVSKKVGKSVVRSTVKRQMRESYRLNDMKIIQGYDLVFVARQGCNGASFQEIQSALLHLIGMKKLLRKR
ncbi:ribonuclease P protein component [Clostridium formicaceticum]|uniref:Ribonuclease P protein component n=1 Tax=Clostridium formicaceticum TaxID=1497 RepID=A0AAC9RMC3_9CLOT|nr:ribonuclease P protein component [Clostridium formicaceticum]AOY75414.1 ribonuclease P protein component [Clostridium formicaceticum]ARE89871.1 Ribonuclease P protein component [Clostridium formicaceticum]